jgi:flagellar protein FlgJ
MRTPGSQEPQLVGPRRRRPAGLGQRGEGPVGYVLVAALLAILAIGVVPAMRTDVAGVFGQVLGGLFRDTGSVAAPGGAPAPGGNPAPGGSPAPGGTAAPPGGTAAPGGTASPGPGGGSPPASGQPFVDIAGPAAVPSRDEYGVPASVTVAQAILESRWGKSKLATESNNYFGIKCHGGKAGGLATGCRTYRTRECDSDGCHYVDAQFRVYASMADSFRDHAVFLRNNPRYAEAFRHTDDPERFARELQRAGYATDPHYADSLIKLIRRYHLERYDG